MIWRLGASAQISQTESAESRDARQIRQTVSVASPWPEANPQSMRQHASDQSVLAFAEGTHGNRPTLSDLFPHAGPTYGRLALSQLTVKNSATPLRISASQSIPETPSRISASLSPGTAPSLARLAKRFLLGRSHYVTLLSVTDPDARRFYEIEAADNGWSVRELKRQLDSSLYERLALSRDKHEVHDRKKDAIVELTLPEDANIYASKYQLYLPSKQELAEQLAMVRREVAGGDGQSHE